MTRRRRRTLATLAVVAVLGPVAVTPSAEGRKAKGAHFALWIEQGGVVVPARGGVVRLAPAPFVLCVLFRRKGGVSLNASTSPATFNALKRNKPLAQIKGLPPAGGMAEAPGNKQRELWLAKAGYHYLYIKSSTDHRFSKIARRGGATLGRRAVAKLFDVDKKRAITLSTMKGRTLYLSAVKTSWKKNHSGQNEHQRLALELRFTGRRRATP